MTYVDYKMDFIKKHYDSDWTVQISPMDKNGQYAKNYIFEDGAVLTEINRPVYEEVEVEVKGVRVKVEVKLMETEAWNTDDATSVKWYEKW